MIDSRFVVNLKGKDFVTWPGLLDQATKAGLQSLKTQPVQLPSAENGGLAVVQAVAIFADGREFSDVADAGPGTCSPQIAAAALRMASTRAKARVLRDALNVGVCSFEELPDEGKAEPTGRIESAPGASCEGCSVTLSAGQAAFCQHNDGRMICPSCRRNAKAA